MLDTFQVYNFMARVHLNTWFGSVIPVRDWKGRSPASLDTGWCVRTDTEAPTSFHKFTVARSVIGSEGGRGRLGSVTNL